MQDDTPKINSKKVNNTMRYAALGTELMVLIGLGVWGGLKLDQWLRTSPLFLLVLPVLGLIIAFYQLLKSLNKK